LAIGSLEATTDLINKLLQVNSRFQRYIVAELDTSQAEVDARKRLHAETTAELDASLPALLERAFKGEF
jgi:hypothetical protein